MATIVPIENIAEILFDDNTATVKDLFNSPSIVSKLKENLNTEQVHELLQGALETLTTKYNVSINI